MTDDEQLTSTLELSLSSMAPKACLALIFIFSLKTVFSETSTTVGVYTFPCSDHNKSCSFMLYNHNNLQIEQIAFYYSVNKSQISPVSDGTKGDFLVTVPCSCNQVNGTDGYFYDTQYKVLPNDLFANVSSQVYSGQSWPVGRDESFDNPKRVVPEHLLCGCVESESEIVVTYTVQDHDTLSDIAKRLSARIDGIVNLNQAISEDSGFIGIGWVLFVPMEKNGIPSPGAASAKKRHHWVITLGILLGVALLLLSSIAVILLMRYRVIRNQEATKLLSKSLSTHSHKLFHLNTNYQRKGTIEDIPIFESERPVIYSLEDVAKATSNFDETRKIGEGGYGCVYFCVLGEQEIAVKKMKSNLSKEFFAELKVLCKIHHINVVELLGYASGDDHLYLVYEFVANGSLSDHLHDPLLKGHQPLTWTARSQIALGAAKGIEYIHDHTKTRYVHRDIKTANILLDEVLKAKVGDFGLAKLVGRTNEDSIYATRLVGTPGYLPPESVKELQVTVKTDVFAFGVVLAELITGYCALMRDKQEPTKTKSVITIIRKIFEDEDSGSALEHIIDVNLQGSYPLEYVFKMAEIAEWCLSEDALDRPEMREVVQALSQITVSSIEWEASLGGDSYTFSGLFSGR